MKLSALAASAALAIALSTPASAQTTCPPGQTSGTIPIPGPTGQSTGTIPIPVEDDDSLLEDIFDFFFGEFD